MTMTDSRTRPSLSAEDIGFLERLGELPLEKAHLDSIIRELESSGVQEIKEVEALFQAANCGIARVLSNVPADFRAVDRREVPIFDLRLEFVDCVSFGPSAFFALVERLVSGCRGIKLLYKKLGAPVKDIPRAEVLIGFTSESWKSSFSMKRRLTEELVAAGIPDSTFFTDLVPAVRETVSESRYVPVRQEAIGADVHFRPLVRGLGADLPTLAIPTA